MYFSVAAPVQDFSVPVPVFTGMVDAFPAIPVGVDPTVCPLGYELGHTPTLEVVSGPSPDRLSAVSPVASDASVATTPPIVAIPKRPRLTGPAAADPVPLPPPTGPAGLVPALPLQVAPYEVPFQGVMPPLECDRRSNALARASSSVSSARYRAM